MGILKQTGAPPVASARHGKTGQLRTAFDGLLVLPDEQRPEVGIFVDATGRWVADEGNGTRLVADREIIVADGEVWIVDLPSTETQTAETNALLPALDNMTLRFTVTDDDSYIELTVVHEGGTTAMRVRAHHYLLLLLARAMVDDQAASRSERGWVDREVLCRMMYTDAPRLGMNVLRARKQFATLIHGAAEMIERRAGQLRLGTDRIELTSL